MNRAPARTSGASPGALTFHIRLAITLSAVLLGTLPAAPMIADQVDLRGVAAEVELAALAQRQLNRTGPGIRGAVGRPARPTAARPFRLGPRAEHWLQ